MTPLASREMTEQEMINTCTAPQMAHLIQVLRQTIRNKDKEIEKWVDMVSQLDGELDPPEPAKPEPKPHPIITGYNRLHYIPVDGIKKPGPVMPEPRPLLADAQVGDLCQTRGEGYHLISDVYTDQRKYAYERNCGDTIYVRENGMFNLINHEHPFDIIHTEPLAEEGSAEWAWQMLILGKPVTNKWVFMDGGYIKDTDSDKYRFVQMWDFFSDWQLYEEKPEPEYKVGDWVEFNPGNNPKQVEIVEIDGDKLYYNTRYAGKTIKTHIYASAITRKLDPSEVKVTLTLEGTVQKDHDNAFILTNTNGTRNRIKWTTIDLDTAKLVRELLDKQGGGE